MASDPGSWRRCWMAPGRLDPVESGQARLPGFRAVKRTLTSTSHRCLSAVSGCGRGSTTHRRSLGARVGTWAAHSFAFHFVPEHVYTHLGWRHSNAAGKHTAVAVFFKRARAAPRDDASTQTRWRRCDDGFERQAVEALAVAGAIAVPLYIRTTSRHCVVIRLPICNVTAAAALGALLQVRVPPTHVTQR